MFTVLAINPGSTSTKLGLFRDRECLFERTLRHTEAELGEYGAVINQLGFRRKVIADALAEAGYNTGFDAIVGRGGLLRPISSGTYEVNARMKADLESGRYGEHASNLGGLLALGMASGCGAKAFIADPVVVDEMDDTARITGLPQIERRSVFHALNQKAVAREYARSVGRPYEELNLVVAHLGGGISVGAHRKGRVVDVTNALDGEGGFSPERSGALPAADLVRLCFGGKYTEAEIMKMVAGKGGVVAHLGTNDVRGVENMIGAGDRRAKQLLDAMCYNTGKSIGAMAAVLKGKVDAIILTGGIAHGLYERDYIASMVGAIAPVVPMPGENELEALAANALAVLEGCSAAKNY